MPIAFLRSRVHAELSPCAAKLLFDMCGQLGWNAKNNGDLSVTPSLMRPRGWRSNATLLAALRELQEANLVVTTRQGGRNRCSLYAVTLWPMHCDISKLDYGPGCYKSTDWEADPDRAGPPTVERPATWRRARGVGSSSPARGEHMGRLAPLRGKAKRAA